MSSHTKWISHTLLWLSVFSFIYLSPNSAITEDFADTTSITELQNKIDSLSVALQTFEDNQKTQDELADHYLDRVLDHLDLVLAIALTVILGVVGVLGVFWPLHQLKGIREDFVEKMKTQSDTSDKKLNEAIKRVKSEGEAQMLNVVGHSDQFSVAISNYLLGVIMVNKAEGRPEFFRIAFNNFALCLLQLTKISYAKSLPMVYEACLKSIRDCSEYKWGDLVESDVDLVKECLEFLNNTWKGHEQIIPYVRQIERWFANPPDTGRWIPPPSGQR